VPSELKWASAQGKHSPMLQASRVLIGQSEEQLQQLKTTAPPYMPLSESGGTNCTNWQSHCSNVMVGREPSAMQHSPRVQTSAPPYVQWAANSTGDWQGEPADIFRGSGQQQQQAALPQLARAPYLAPWADDGDCQNGQTANFGVPQVPNSMSHSGVCCAEICFGLSCSGATGSPAPVTVMPSGEWMSPAAQWPQMGALQLVGQSNRELEELLLRATPEFYDD